MVTPPPIVMANLGMTDTLILMVMALVVFGPRRLPKIGRQIGKLMYEFRKASNDFKFQMEEEFRAAEEADRRKKEEEERQRALAAAPPPPQLQQTTAAEPATGVPAPDSDAPAPPSSQSPYPGETTYPASAAAPSAETAQSTETLAAETAPRIQPPSTGETVAAERPGPAPASAANEAERSETAAHHG